MRTLFSIVFVIISLFLCTLIVSLIPINVLGNSIIKDAKDNNINFVAKNSWNLRLFGLKGTTDKFEYSIDIGDNKISGHGENFVYGLTSGSIYSEKILLDIYISKENTLADIINFLKEKISKKYFYIRVKKLVINIYFNDKKNDEIIINDIKITKQKDFEFYSMNLGINKDKKNNILITVNHPNTEKYEMNAKIEDDNFLCYISDSEDGGNVNCLVQNLLVLIENLREKKIDNKIYKKLFDKRFSLKANIVHRNSKKKDIFDMKGKLLINNDSGDINFNSESNLLDISFDELNLDKTTFDVKDMFQNEFEKEQNLQAIAMSGDENKILNSKKKSNLESVNALSKMALYFFQYMKNIKFHTQIDIKKSVINDIKMKNIIIDISKNVNNKINLNEISADFGENFDNSILIKSSNNNIGNLFINGKKDIDSFLKLFNLKIFDIRNNINYRVTGDLKLSINAIAFDNVSFFVDEVKVLNYSNVNVYDYENNDISHDEKIFIQNINLNKYFNFKQLFKDLYNNFNDFQQNEKQDAIFWKYLFEKRNKKNHSNVKKVLSLNNLLFYDKKINYFVSEYEDSNKKTNIDVISDGDIIGGKIHFDLENFDKKEIIHSDMNVKNIDLNFNKIFHEDIQLACNRSFSEIFYEDKDYNIPSLVGLNGSFDLKIDKFSLNKKIFNEIDGKIDIDNGVISTEGFKFKYNNSLTEINASMLLQGRPELQIAFSSSGLKIKDVVNSPLDGYFSLQANLKTFSFNPVKFFHNLNGGGKFVVQNIAIPNFDLLQMSSEVITNGLRSDYDYKGELKKSSLYFPEGEGNFLLENGIVKGNLTLSRELVSGSVVFEYGIFTNILRQMSGSFAVMMARKRLSTPFPIYIPFACNGEAKKPECLVKWEQLDETLANIYQSV